jgi:hypothetical protein
MPEPLTLCLDWIDRQLRLNESDPSLSLAELVWRQRCAIELYNELNAQSRVVHATSHRLDHDKHGLRDTATRDRRGARRHSSRASDYRNTPSHAAVVVSHFTG